jgi:hypothetical protein
VPPGADITSDVWAQLNIGMPAPTALDRAMAVVSTHEGTDYDTVEWNICVSWTGDTSSILTWGPYGFTLGWGGELLNALRKMDQATVAAAFTQEGAIGLDRLLALQTRDALGISSGPNYPGASALMYDICRSEGQMDAWRRAFARLGADANVREIYEEHAWGQESWFRYIVNRLEQSYRSIGLQPTEVDFAFLLDRSIHMGWSNARFEAVDAALARIPEGERSNARARFAIADSVRASGHPMDRLARDTVFLIDDLPTVQPAMAGSRTWPRSWWANWQQRSGLSASDFGLSDTRRAPSFGPLTRMNTPPPHWEEDQIPEG